jgi:hypothetical protein
MMRKFKNPRNYISLSSDHTHYELTIIKRSTGEKFVVKFDACDYELVSSSNWYVDSNGYAMRYSDGINTRHMHRAILEIGADKKVFGDHKDGDPFNNRRSNLRGATPLQNSFNKKTQKRSRSSFKGVTWHAETEKWRCRIRYLNKLHSLGLYSTPQEAARAYDTKAKEFFGEFAKTNF